jgi:nitrite reductase (NADH) large subunit
LVYTYQNGADEIYKRLVVSADKKKLLGAVLVGDATGYGTLSQYYLNGIDLPESPDSLIFLVRNPVPTLKVQYNHHTPLPL